MEGVLIGGVIFMLALTCLGVGLLVDGVLSERLREVGLGLVFIGVGLYPLLDL